MRKYYYRINLDERGEFYADVTRNLQRGKSEFELHTDDLRDLVQDGVMRNKNDIVGLGGHLKRIGVLPKDSMLVSA